MVKGDTLSLLTLEETAAKLGTTADAVRTKCNKKLLVSGCWLNEVWVLAVDGAPVKDYKEGPDATISDQMVMAIMRYMWTITG